MLRPFQKKDATACFEILLEAAATMGGLNEAARAYVVTKTNADILFDELSRLYCLVFDDHGQALGFGALDGAEVKRVYIAASARGRGIGSSIMQALEQQAKQGGLKTLDVKASPSSVSFYEKCGFETIEPGAYRTGKAVFRYVVMRKAL